MFCSVVRAAEHRRCAGWARLLGGVFDNPERMRFTCYGSHDRGASWKVVYTFEKNAIRPFTTSFMTAGRLFLGVDRGCGCGMSHSMRFAGLGAASSSVISGNNRREPWPGAREDGVIFRVRHALETELYLQAGSQGNLKRLA